MSNLISYYEQYALISLEKQEKFGHLMGEHLRELDLDSGLIRFSGGLEFLFQILGTESDNTLTWLWAWADEQAEIPSALLESSIRMREWGSKESVPECTIASVDLGKADGHVLSIIASEVCRASCYYRDSYDGGALFLLLFGESIDRQPPLDAAGLFRQCSLLMSMHELNLRNALLAYVRAKSMTFEEQGAQRISFRLESGEDVNAGFDPAGKLLELNGRPVL